MGDPILPIILSGIKLEMQTMNKSLSQMIKTHAAVLSEEWITKDQALAILKISLRSLNSLKSSNKLAFSKINGINYYRVKDIEDLLRLNYINHSTDHPSNLKSPK